MVIFAALVPRLWWDAPKTGHRFYVNTFKQIFCSNKWSEYWFRHLHSEPYKQGICSNHLILCLALNFIFGYCSRACPVWKPPCTFFAGTCQSHNHDVMGEKYLLTKPIKFDLNGKRILCSSIFAIEPISGFCPFMGYWPSKNASRYHVIKDEFVSLAKPIVLSTIRKRILCWSILALDSMANLCPFLGCWTSKNGSCDHDVKGNLPLMQNL